MVFREYKIIGMDEMQVLTGLLLMQKAPFTGLLRRLGVVPRETLGGFTRNHVAFTLCRHLSSPQVRSAVRVKVCETMLRR